MVNKTFDELYQELPSDTVQGKMLECLNYLYSEHLRNGYMNYDVDKHEYNRNMIDSMLPGCSIHDAILDAKEYCVENELRWIISSGLFELDSKKLLELKASYDQCSMFDDCINFLKEKLPNHADLIEDLRVDVPFGALSDESGDVLRKLYYDSLDIIPDKFREPENMQAIKDKYGDRSAVLMFGCKSRYDANVKELIEREPNIVPLIERLRPLIASIPFQLGLLEPNLEGDLDAVEKIIEDYCNSHPELVELEHTL